MTPVRSCRRSAAVGGLVLHRIQHFEALRPRESSKGFTLLEVLISIILLGIGVLGMVGLQAWSIRANQQAHYQATAVRLSRELGELMRSNAATASLPGTGNNYLIDSDTAVPASATNCFTSACTAGADVATWDVYEWYQRVNAELPGARAVVCFDSAPYAADGTPQWGCTASSTPANDSPVIKIGWTRASTQNDTAPDQATKPGVIVPVGLH